MSECLILTTTSMKGKYRNDSIVYGGDGKKLLRHLFSSNGERERERNTDRGGICLYISIKLKNSRHFNRKFNVNQK
jgi:hypothetical protein